MSYQKDRDEFIGVIVQECNAGRDRNHAVSDAGVNLARLILRNAATMQRLAERACSVEMSERQATREEKQDAACQARIEAACKPWGIVPTFNGDPRGAVVKLILPSGRWNSWGGKEDGFCVPTR
ncbi:MAG TPA: hypothetical protein VMY35_15980 [Phycisphaerae bacterium]|nr:hypothetical protein [Phycisphaerae bacterium]